MTLQQVSVFVENKKGRLAVIVKVLADNGINIRALSMADTTHYGILRLITDNPDKAEKALTAAGFTVSLTTVIGVRINDTPGGLSETMRILTENEISIEYLYAFSGTIKGNAYVIIRVEDSDRTVSILSQNGITLLDAKKLSDC